MELTFNPGAAESEPLVGGTVEAFLDAADTGAGTEPKASFKNQEDAPPCSNCGSITVRAGACYSCPNCGASSGCG
jgi:ribonucleoside-diphosphate reductase alpha chain